MTVSAHRETGPNKTTKSSLSQKNIREIHPQGKIFWFSKSSEKRRMPVSLETPDPGVTVQNAKAILSRGASPFDRLVLFVSSDV